MTTVAKPGLPLLSPTELQGILGDLPRGRSFVEELLAPTPHPRRNGVILKAKTQRHGLPQASSRYEGGTVQRGPGSLIDGVPFLCQPYSHEEGTPWDDVTDAASYIPLYAFNAQVARDVCATDRDKDAATTIGSASWGYTDTTGNANDRWSASTSNPIKALLNAKQGCRPANVNAALFAQDVWAAFQVNEKVLSTMNTSADHAIADVEWFKKAVAAKLGIEKVVIVDAMYNTANTLASQTLAELFAGKVWVGQLSGAGLSAPSGVAGLDATALARIVQRDLYLHEYDEDQSRSRIAQAYMSEITVAADLRLGGLISNILG